MILDHLKNAGIVLDKYSLSAFNRLGQRGTFKTTCPECSEDRRKSTETCLSITFNESGAVGFCHHCGHKLVVGNGLVADRSERFYTKPEPEEETLSEAAILWAKSRGISEKILRNNKVYSVRTWMPGLDKEVPAVAFPYYRNGELINTKYRSLNEKSFKLVRGAELIPYRLDSINPDCVTVVEGECLPGDSEVLTPLGWLPLQDYNGGDMVQFNPDHTLSVVKPTHWVRSKFDGNLIQYKNARGFATISTPQHKMVAMDKDKRVYKHEAQNFPLRWHNIPRVGMLDGPGIPLSDDQLAFCVAVSADVSMREKTSKGINCVAAFKKTRKIIRFKRLLNTLGIVNTGTEKLESNPGYSHFCFKLPEWCPGRIFPVEWLLSLSKRQREFILSELVHWDGNSVPNRNQHEYSSKYKENADWVQALSHTTGRVSTIIGRGNQFGKWFKVSILHSKSYSSHQSFSHNEIPFNGTVYCVKVPSGMFLVRQNNCIYVTGNCDALSMVEAGFNSVVSVPNGAPSEGAKNLDNHLSCLSALPENITKFVIAVDNDGPGQQLKNALIERLGKAKCFVVEWAEGCKDANDVLIKYGKDKLKELVESAVPVIPRLKIRKVTDPYIPPPPEIVLHTARGDIALIQSATNIGKSSLLRNLAIKLARGEEFEGLNHEYWIKKRVMLGNFEFVDPMGDIKKMLNGKSDYGNIGVIHQPTYGEEELNLKNPDHFNFFRDGIKEFGADVIIVDTYASSFKLFNENDNAEASSNVKALIRLAKDCNAVVVLSHHLGKMKSEADGVIQAYRGRGASSLPSGASSVFNLDADPVNFRFVTVTCGKNKAGLGEYQIPLVLDTATRWFSRAEEAEQQNGTDNN